MHDDIEYRVMLVRAMREAGASFDVIAEVLRTRTRLARRREGLQSSFHLIQEHQAAQRRQDVAAALRDQQIRYVQIGEALGVSYDRARNLIKKAKKRAAMPQWLEGLDLRIANALLRAGFQSIEEVRKAITQGKPIERIKDYRREVIQVWLEQTATAR